MPPGTNAVLPFAAATINGGMLEIEEPVAPGDGVETAGAAWRRGDTIAPAGRRLTAFDRARVAEAGLEGVEVFRRPAVRIIVPGPKGRQGSADALLLMLDGLIERDGGFASAAAPAPEIATALRDTGAADLVLIAGRSGSGADDEAAPALAAVGQVDVHGVAIAPGGSAGLGRIGGVPVVLLPGEPLACLAAYELLAGRAVRQLAGLPARLPHPRRRLPLSAKIASQVGMTELWLVRPDGDGVAPLAPPDRAVLATTAAALGFVLVPAESEGHQVGSQVEVHLFDQNHV
jgi:molybdopterin molybdotransferase